MPNFFAQSEGADEMATSVKVRKSWRIKRYRKKILLKFYLSRFLKGTNLPIRFFIDKLTPKSLGSLIACNEQQIFVQGNYMEYL